MRFIFDRNNEHVYNTVEAYKQRVNQHRSIYTADHADRLGKAASAYHWVDPGILSSTVLANADDSLPMIAKESAKQMALAGFTPADRIRTGSTSQQRMVDTTDFVQRMTQATPPVAPTSRTTESKKDQGFWGKVANFTHLAQAVDWVTPDVIQNAIGDVVRPSYSAVKTAGQWWTGTQNFVPQLLSAELYDAFNLFPSSHSYHSTGNRNLIDTFVKGPLEQTSIGQQALKTADYVTAKLSKSTPDTKWKDVAGDGFFTGGLAEKARTDAAWKYRQLVGTTPETMVPFTLGRANAQVAADLGVIEEGGTAYNAISGAIDLLTWVSLDPTFQGSITSGAFGLGKVYGKMGTGLKSSNALVELSDVEKAWQTLSDAEKTSAGVVSGTRKTVVPEIIDSYLTKPSTQKLLEPLVNTTKADTADIWRSAFRGDGILSARAVAEAGTHDEVANAFRDAVNTFDTSTNVNVRNLPSGKLSSSSDLGFLIKDSSQRFTHTFDILPESTYIPQDNINLAAQRLDSLMAVFNADMPTRNGWINQLVDTHLDGSKKAWFDFYGSFTEDLLGKQMFDYGFDQKYITRFTRWSKESVDMAQRFSLQDLMDGVPTQYLDGAGYGPTRLTQLLANGAFVFDPTEIKTVMREMGRIEQFAKSVDYIAETAKSPATQALAKTLGKSIDGSQAVLRGLELYQGKLWKISKVARPTYLFKVLPDETAKVLMSGTFDHPIHYIASVFDGSWAAKLGANGKYVADVFGEPINKAILKQELEMVLDEYKTTEQQINSLFKYGKSVEAQDLLDLYKNEIDQIPVLEARLEKVVAQHERDSFALHQALIGRKGSKSSLATITGDYNAGVHVKSGILDIANKDIPSQKIHWVNGIGKESADLNRTEPIRRIANGGLFPSDILTIDGVEAKWADHLKAGRVLGYDDAVKEWLINGKGNKFLLQYQKSRFIEGPQPSLEELASDWVVKMDREVQSIAGTNPTMMEAIATGKFEGKKAFEYDSSGHALLAPEFKKFIGEVFANDPSEKTPKLVRAFKTITFKEDAGAMQQIGSKLDQQFNWVAEGFFKGIYGTASDKLARSPIWRRAYWGRVEEIAYKLDPAEAEKLLENAKKANLARPQLDRVKKVLDLAIANKTGDQLLETLDQNASFFATKYYEQLIFTASQRSRFSQMNSLQMPFFEAYREQAKTWLKILTERPENAHYIDLAIKSLRQPLPWSKDVNGDGQRDGFFFRDPQTKQEVWAVPMTSAIASIFSDAPQQNFRIAGKSMTLVSQIVPGFGPIVQYPASHFIPNTKKWEPVSNILFGAGRPEDQSTGPFSVRPIWWKRISPAFAKFAEKGGPLGKMLSEFITFTGGDVNGDEVFKNYYFQVQKSLSSIEPAPKNSQEMEAFLNKVEDQAIKLYALRGLAGAVLPGQPISTFMAETKQGKVELGVLADELRRYEKEATDLGEPWGTGTQRFLETKGQNLWGIFGSSSAPGKVSGLQPSRDWEDWAIRNESFVSDFPGVGAYFGPQEGGFDLAVWQRQRRSGLRPFPTPEDWVKDAENTVASMQYNSVRGLMTVAMQNSSVGKPILSGLRDSLSASYPYWNPEKNGVLSKDRRQEQIRQLALAVNDPSISNNSVAIAAKAYMDFRQTTLDNIKTKYPTLKNWQQSSKTVSERNDLTVLGDALAKSIPEFTPLWQNVLSNEYLVPEMGQ